MAHWFITGARGFIGSTVCRDLLGDGHRVTGLTRRISAQHDPNVTWVERVDQMPEDVDQILNLAGEGIADKRWSPARRTALLDSRIRVTEELAARANQVGVQHVISASAVGYYGSAGEVTEQSAQGSGFAADLCARWEQAAGGFEAPCAVLRLGVVLGGGGFLNRTLLPFSLGLGGPIGSGQQGFSWIHLDDVVAMIRWVSERQQTGVYNATGPQAVTNSDMARALGQAVRRPAVIPAPSLVMRGVFGQMAEELLLAGQMALPARAQQEGFTFRHPDIQSAMRAAVLSKRSGSRGG